MLPRDPVVGRLRIRTQHTDSAALRLAIARSMTAQAIRTSRTGPSSVLLIRTLAASLSDPLDANGQPARDTSQWERSIRRQIDELYDSAERPGRGRIVGDGRAVLFADEAELLACLVLELTAPGPASWWRHAVARYIPSECVFSVLRERSNYLPAVFSILSTWEQTERVATALTQEQAVHLCRELAQEQSLAQLLRVIDEWFADVPIPDTASSTRSDDSSADAESTQRAPSDWQSAGARPDTGTSGLIMASPSPFHDWFTSRSPNLSPAHHLLLGFALGIQRAPMQMRSDGLPRRIAHWLREPQQTRFKAPDRAAPSRDALVTPRTDESSIGAGREPPVGKPSLSNPTPAPGSQSVSEPHTDTPASTESAVGDTTAEPARTAATRPWDVDASLTQLGGVFYLINMMERLGLPECFEEDCRLACAVGAFGILEGIARMLVPQHARQFRDDPIWDLLAKLDRRAAGSPPRCEGLEIGQLQLPQSWFAECASAGSASPTELLTSSAQSIAAIATLRGLGWPPLLLQWLSFVTPFLEWRLRQALAVTPEQAALDSFLRLPARVYVSEAHIDVVASVESVRLPARRAGLDRSPGWVRSLQRVVLFHFE